MLRILFIFLFLSQSIQGLRAQEFSILPGNMIENEVPGDWHQKVNFPEFFFFRRGGEILINIRDVKGDWKTEGLIEDEYGLNQLKVSGDTVYNSYLGYEVNFLHLRWHFQHSHSFGSGGFQTTREWVQILDLDRGEVVAAFHAHYSSSGAETWEAEDSLKTRENACEYEISYSFENGLLQVQKAEVSISYVREYWEKEEPESSGKIKESRHDACIPEIQEGSYQYNGRTYVPLDR